MSIQNKIAERFKELEERLGSLRKHSICDGTDFRYESDDWQQWATSAMSVILRTFGEKSPHFQNIQKTYDKCGPKGFREDFSAIVGVFRAAKDDFEGGYLFSVETVISGEVLADFVVLAKAALDGGHTHVAAVLACAALEDALKRYAALKGLNVGDRTMQEVVGALKGQGLVSGAQKTLLDSMPKIRDYAMHANWDKIKPEDISGVIGFVEEFLHRHFS